MQRAVYAHFDEEGIYVYQAFKPEIVRFAVENGTFGKGFGLDRITWIKPSFAWILRRSEYASKHRMERIAKIKLSHESWLTILEISVETQWNSYVYPNEDSWYSAQQRSDVIHQWDPERHLDGRRLERQAIQIGLRGDMIRKYISEFILSVEDVTPMAKEIGKLVKAGKPIHLSVPAETEYPLPAKLISSLGYRSA